MHRHRNHRRGHRSLEDAVGEGRGGGHGHRPFGPGGARRGGRARRGDVRAAILALLGESPMHGYQIIQELETRSNGLWRASPGSIYPTLQLFEDEGLVSASEVDGKRVFQLTDTGRERLAEAVPSCGHRPAGQEVLYHPCCEAPRHVFPSAYDHSRRTRRFPL